MSNLGPGVVLLAWSLSAGGCVFFHLGSGEGGAGGATTTTSTGGAGGQGGAGGASGSPKRIGELNEAGRGYAVGWNGEFGAALAGDEMAADARPKLVFYFGRDEVGMPVALSLDGAVAILPGGSTLVSTSNEEGPLSAISGGEGSVWGGLGSDVRVSGIAVFEELAVLVVQRSPAILHRLSTNGVVAASTTSLVGQLGGHVTVGRCGGAEMPRVVWTSEDVDEATLRLATLDLDPIADPQFATTKLGRPALEPDCATVVFSDDGDQPRYLRVPPDDPPMPVPLDAFSLPDNPAFAHVATDGQKLFLTVKSSEGGVEVLSCGAGASDPGTCRSTQLGCSSVGGLAAAAGSVVFTCGDEVYRWE